MPPRKFEFFPENDYFMSVTYKTKHYGKEKIKSFCCR